MSDDDRRYKRGYRKHKKKELAALKAEPNTDREEPVQPRRQEEVTPNNNNMSKLYSVLFHNKSAAWTSIFTCVLMIFSVLLYFANRDANDTSIATQRAFISWLGMGTVEKVPGDGSPLTGYNFHLPMINSGTTATKYAIYELAPWISTSVIQQTTDFDALQQSEQGRFCVRAKASIRGHSCICLPGGS
jgi:hypothetical protein